LAKVDFLFQDGTYLDRTVWRETVESARNFKPDSDESSLVQGSAFAAAVKSQLREYRGQSPEKVARDLYSKNDYRFIFINGYSRYAPGNFGLGADLIFRRYPTRIFSTSDSIATDEEAKVFAEAGDFAKRFNETMFNLMVDGGQLFVFEVGYLVKEDAGIVIGYLSGETITLREKAGKTRVVWLDRADGFSVRSGSVLETRRGRVERLVIAE